MGNCFFVVVVVAATLLGLVGSWGLQVDDLQPKKKMVFSRVK